MEELGRVGQVGRGWETEKWHAKTRSRKGRGVGNWELKDDFFLLQGLKN
jgi:hypothetical protein